MLYFANPQQLTVQCYGDSTEGLSMATDEFKITFECKKCGGTVLDLPDNHTDDSIAKCKSCGTEFGRYGDIKKKARDLAADHLQGMVKDAFAKAFKGKKGWTVK
jgi:hypothetical protein